jgi:hypothetical protein
MEGRAVGHNFERDPPRDHPCQVWFNLDQRFRGDLNVKVYDVRRIDDDGRQVMAKVHMAFGQVS